MPTYDYHCANCNAQHEIIQKITDEPIKTCPDCNKDSLQRGPGGGIGLMFKGSGFYCTDYASTSTSKSKLSQASSTPAKSECCPCGKSKNSCSN